MVNVRPEPRARFNVLLTEDRQHTIEHWTQQLPRLLQPHGVQAFVARSGREALELAEQREIHAAFIDLLTPASDPRSTTGPGGLWLMQLLRRLPRRPPIVLVTNDVYFDQRQIQRLINEALRLGAFSVINRPVELNALLQVIRRLIDRQYAGTWPTSGDPQQRGEQPADFRDLSNPFENPELNDSADY